LFVAKTLGECDENPGYMLENCAKSCGACKGREQRAKPPTHLVGNPETLLERTVKFGDKQAATGDKRLQTLGVVQDMLDYMESSDEFMALPTKIQENCRNKHELCAFWSAIGECSANMAFMKIQCAPGMCF
jgi:ShK domain-like